MESRDWKQLWAEKEVKLCGKSGKTSPNPTRRRSYLRWVRMVRPSHSCSEQSLGAGSSRKSCSGWLALHSWDRTWRSWSNKAFCGPGSGGASLCPSRSAHCGVPVTDYLLRCSNPLHAHSGNSSSRTLLRHLPGEAAAEGSRKPDSPRCCRWYWVTIDTHCPCLPLSL